MRVYGGLIMLAAYFCHHAAHKVSSLIKVDWPAACIALRVVGAVLVVHIWRWRKIRTILQPIVKQELILEEMS